jgi:NAD(P) transhydrogenase
VDAYDVVVLGGGPGGERAAIQAARAARRVVLVEREHVVGGTCINWGTIPSKTLRESAVFVRSLTTNKLEGIRCSIGAEITVPDFMHRERVVVQRELELINRTLDRYRIEVVRGHGRFVDPRTVSVSRASGSGVQLLRGDVFVIATGTSPNRPADVPFDDNVVFDSNTILNLRRMPRTMIVLGAGVIGVEYASIFAALGIRVTLVDTREQLLPYLDREIAGILEREMTALGIEVVHSEHYRSIEIEPSDPPRVRLKTRKGARLEAEVLLYAVGRDGNSRDLGLENIGLVPGSRGLIEVNEFYQTGHPHIYAVGDLIGYPALASTSAEQGRQAIRHAFNIPGPKGRTEILPFAIYAIPEVGFIGDTEESLARRGAQFVVGRGQYGYNPRGQILGDTGGMLKLLFEFPSLRLLGVHVIGTSASELVHVGQAFLLNRADANHIAETLFNYPTLSDLYRHAGLEAVAAARRRREASPTGPPG